MRVATEGTGERGWELRCTWGGTNVREVLIGGRATVEGGVALALDEALVVVVAP